jgi:hypothetical protein
MPQWYGYPEQSFSQVLISIESCVACLGTKKKLGKYTNFYVMFHYDCGLIL